jgi:uncharacterized alpha-E superfamily protein
MLSRAAERVYWTGRYLERAENTARIVQQYSHLLLDLPEEAGASWEELAPVFDGGGGVPDGVSNVLRYMLVDRNNPSSLRVSLQMARDNIRNVRDLLPIESWESVNELYRFSIETLDSTRLDDEHFEILAQCIGRCQQLGGCLSNTMSHRSPYQFLTLGQQIERADMTTRIIDVAVSYMERGDRLAKRYASTLWTNLLKTVGAFQMYRQYVQPQVNGSKIVNFLVNDVTFPRSVSFCMQKAVAAAHSLPRGAAAIAQLAALEEALTRHKVADMDAMAVSEWMDEIQVVLGLIHDCVATTWFEIEAHG